MSMEVARLILFAKRAVENHENATVRRWRCAEDTFSQSDATSQRHIGGGFPFSFSTVPLQAAEALETALRKAKADGLSHRTTVGIRDRVSGKVSPVYLKSRLPEYTICITIRIYCMRLQLANVYLVTRDYDRAIVNFRAVLEELLLDAGSSATFAPPAAIEVCHLTQKHKPCREVFHRLFFTFPLSFFSLLLSCIFDPSTAKDLAENVCMLQRAGQG